MGDTNAPGSQRPPAMTGLQDTHSRVIQFHMRHMSSLPGTDTSKTDIAGGVIVDIARQLPQLQSPNCAPPRAQSSIRALPCPTFLLPQPRHGLWRDEEGANNPRPLAATRRAWYLVGKSGLVRGTGERRGMQERPRSQSRAAPRAGVQVQVF